MQIKKRREGRNVDKENGLAGLQRKKGGGVPKGGGFEGKGGEVPLTTKGNVDRESTKGKESALSLEKAEKGRISRADERREGGEGQQIRVLGSKRGSAWGRRGSDCKEKLRSTQGLVQKAIGNGDGVTKGQTGRLSGEVRGDADDKTGTSTKGPPEGEYYIWGKEGRHLALLRKAEVL